jgi:predicted molibdopterin-dependent oxidoreductase YjgC
MEEGRTIHLTINGQHVETPEGSTILEAARKAGIYIPTLCSDEGLEPRGTCRLCIVSVEGMGGLPCVTPAAEGMKVTTENPEIFQVRKVIAELLLADHPDECLTCASSQTCELQKIVNYLGIRERRFRRIEREAVVDDSNPFFVRDMRKCVLCGRCVRTCLEIRGVGAVGITGRGYENRVSTFCGFPIAGSECESCGECVVHCPTGALSFKDQLPADRYERSICPYCGTGCGLLVGVRGGRVVSTRGDVDNPVNRGQLCVKGRFGIAGFVEHPDRLRAPLVRKGGELREASWDEALDLVAGKLAGMKGDSFALLASAKIANEDNYLLQKFTRAVMGTNNVDHCARL